MWAYLFETVYHKAPLCIKVLNCIRRNIWSFLYQLLLFSLPTIILSLSKLLCLINAKTNAPFWIVGVLSVVVLALKLINEKKVLDRMRDEQLAEYDKEVQKDEEKLIEDFMSADRR